MTLGRATENTDRDLLIQQLDNDLEDYDVLHDISFEYFDQQKNRKTFRIPDILIVKKEEYERKEKSLIFNPNSVIAIIEAENIDVHEGFSQVMGYYALLENNIGGIRAIFSTEYKRIIGVNFEDEKQYKEDNYSQIKDISERMALITKFIINFIFKKIELLSIEDGIEFFINFFESQINILSKYTRNLSSSLVENITGLFFAKTLDIEIAQDQEFQRIVDKAGAYLIVNQVFFYHLMSKVREDCEVLKPIKSTEELQNLFNKVVKDINYKPIFKAKIIENLSDDALNPLNNLINTIIYLKFETIKEDIIGRIFHDLIPATIRKRIAAYFTKIAPAKLLADLTITKHNQVVLDPTCGSGTLLLAAYQRKAYLYQENGISNFHSQLLRELFGNDICLFSAHLSAINISLQDANLDAKDLVIFLKDIFKTTPGTRSISLNHIGETEDYIHKKGRPLPPKVDVLLMNPPFTKISRIDKGYLKFVKGKLKEQVKEYFLKGQTGLQILVPLFTDDFLKIKGRIGMVIPETILSYTDTTGFQDFFKKFYKIEYLISSEAEISFSESCDWKDFLFIGRKVRNYKNHVIPKMKENHYNKIPLLSSYFIKFVLLKEELTINNYREVFKLISTQQENFENDRIKIILVNNMELEQTNQWIQFFRRDLVFTQFLNFSLDYLIKGTDIFAIQRRGFYIYGKDFFFFPNKYWDIIRDNDDSIDVINLDTEEELTIEKEYLNLTLRSPGIHQQYIIPETNYYVLKINDELENLPEALQRYIGWSDILEDRELTAREKDPINFFQHTGNQIESGAFGRIAIPEKYKPHNRGISAHLLENVIVPVSYYTKSTRNERWDRIICAWLNSSIGLLIRFNARVVLGSASERLNGEQINQLYYPNINEIDNKDIEIINNLFNNLINQSPLPPLEEQLSQEYRRDLDRAFLDSFNYPENLQEDFLSYIYSTLRHWIET